MPKDFTATIGALRDAAVGRCRDRIEQAAIRARDLVGSGKPADTAEERHPCGKEYGVTSVLKQRHGL